MRRYSWTKTTMVVAEVGGAYVTYHDHQRAMADKDAELQKMRYVVEAARAIDKEAFAKGTENVDPGRYRGLGVLLEQLDDKSAVASSVPEPTYVCNICKDTGCTDCY